jgi:opacity protein-like surface antigen
MKCFLCLIGLASLFAMAASAADITGKWKANVDTPNGGIELTFDLKADAAKLTGTVGSPMGEQAISDGKVDGDNLSFTVKFNGQNGEFVINYKGKVTGSEMKLTSSFPGREETFELTAKKVS